MPQIQLHNEQQVVEYGPVQFHDKNTELWLPQKAEIYLDIRKRHYYRSHTFDHYMLFSIDSEEKRNEGALGKAMIFGPNMQNFADVAGSLVQQNGAVQVRDRAELEKALGDLLADEARREQVGRNALRVVHENLGAINRTVDMIVDHLVA